MSWVPPFHRCGECGGDIARWPVTNLLRQEVLDWRHKTIPTGALPHRAVLGTPAYRPQTPEQSRGEEPADLSRQPPPPPVEKARPALHGDLPPSAARLDRKGEENGWLVRAWYMHGPLMDSRWNFSRMVESVVLHLDRDGHRLIATWQTPAGEDKWKFDAAYSRGHYLRPLSSAELNAAVTTPRALCESCGEPPALHLSTNTGPVCHTERVILPRR